MPPCISISNKGHLILRQLSYIKTDSPFPVPLVLTALSQLSMQPTSKQLNPRRTVPVPPYLLLTTDRNPQHTQTYTSHATEKQEAEEN